MSVARVTQTGLEYSGRISSHARVTQVGAEYSGRQIAGARTTQIGIEYAFVPILEGYYDVSTYLHPGDPDYTAAIGRAESDCEAAGGGVVYFPAGQYAVSGTTTVGRDGVQWRGHGSGASTIISSTGSAPAPTIVKTASGINFFTIAELGFQGNGNPPSGTLVAPPTVVLNGGHGHKIVDTYFTNNTGQTIQFVGATDAEVTGCRFYQVGRNDTTNTGSAYRTDAVTADANSVGIRVHHNYFDTCLFGAIYIGGSQSDVSHNFITNAYVTGIYFNGSNTRVAFNLVQSTVQLTNAATRSAGIQADAAQDFSIIGNNVSQSAGDGIAITNGWSSGTIVGNNSWDNGQRRSDTIAQNGIFINSDKGANPLSDNAMTIVGNNCFDDQASATQKYGIQINSTSNPITQAANCSIVGNSTNGNIVQGIYEQAAVMQVDTNSIFANSDLLERLHSSAPVNTKSFTSPGPIGTAKINAGSMRQRCGIRITAGGTTTGTVAKTFQLGFQGTAGASTNIFNFTTGTLASSPQIWQLIATITNNQNAAAKQAVLAMFFLNNALYKAFELNLTKDTTATQYVTLSAIGASGSMTDYVTCDFFTVERC